uniref:G-protein coupled receptors family 1 profile domain-containing protein n=1 Tax=Plectus sambesii TaxID=2011161 RepID=A0A914VYP2_9BILA
MMSQQNSSTYFQTVSFAQFVIVQALCIPIGIFAVIGNAVVLLAYAKYKMMRKVSCAHLIAALAVCDLINGVGSIILSISRLWIALFDFYDYTRIYCIVTATCWIIAMEMSQIITIAIALDRLMAMSWPFLYSARNHRSFAQGAFLFALFTGIVFIGLSLVGIDFTERSDRCTWLRAVSPLCGDIFLLFNAIVGPLVAALYGMAMYNKKKWATKHVGSEISVLAHDVQLKVNKLLTKIMCVYFILL